MKIYTNKSDKEKLKWFFKKYVYIGKKYLILIIILIIIGSLVANISPYLYGKMLDSITLGDMDFLIKLIISYFFITIFTNLLSMLESYVGQVKNAKKLRIYLRRKMHMKIW